MAIIEGISLSAQQKKKLSKYYDIRFYFSFNVDKGSIDIKSLPLEVKKVSYYPSRRLFRFELDLWHFYDKPEKLLKKIIHSVRGETSSERLVTLLQKRKGKDVQFSLKKKINLSPVQFLTLEEIKEVDKTLYSHPDINRRPEIGAISKFDISEELIKQHHRRAIELLEKIVPDSQPLTIGFFRQIVIKDVCFQKEVVDFISKYTAYSYSLHLLNFEIRPDIFQKFLKDRHKRNIIFMSEDHNDFHGLVLPDPTQNNFLITMPANSSISQLRFRAFWFQAVLRKIFAAEDIRFWHEHIFKIHKSRFYNYLSTQVLEEDYKLNPKLQTLAFDFYNEDDFREKLRRLKGKKIIDLYGFSDIHRYKVIFTPKMESESYSESHVEKQDRTPQPY